MNQCFPWVELNSCNLTIVIIDHWSLSKLCMFLNQPCYLKSPIHWSLDILLLYSHNPFCMNDQSGWNINCLVFRSSITLYPLNATLFMKIILYPIHWTIVGYLSKGINSAWGSLRTGTEWVSQLKSRLLVIYVIIVSSTGKGR